MKTYGTPLPSSADIFNSQFLDIVELQFLNFEGVIRWFNPEFDMKIAILGVVDGVDPTKHSLLNDMMPYITIVCAGLLMMLIMALVMVVSPKHKQAMRNNLKAIKDKMLFNGIIRWVYIGYLRAALAVAAQLYLWSNVKDSLTGADKFKNVLFLIAILAFNLWTWVFLLKKRAMLTEKENFETEEFESFYSKYSNLICKIHLYRSQMNVFFYPIFLSRRVLYALMAYGIAHHPYLQIQLITLTSTLYMIFYASNKPHVLPIRHFQEMMNEVFVMIALYHLFVFTPFNQDEASKFNGGFSFAVFIIIMISFNVAIMFIGSVRTVVMKLKWKYIRN